MRFPDEVGSLAMSIDRMRKRLRNPFQASKRSAIACAGCWNRSTKASSPSTGQGTSGMRTGRLVFTSESDALPGGRFDPWPVPASAFRVRDDPLEAGPRRPRWVTDSERGGRSMPSGSIRAETPPDSQ